MLQGEQQVALKADELLEKTKHRIQIFVPDYYLAHLYYTDFTDKLKNKLNELDITLLIESSPKSVFFIEKMQWPKQKCRMVDAKNLPCFMISDHKELLIAFHETHGHRASEKKKDRTAAIWTNYTAFIWTLQMLFSKLLETGKTAS
jgi:hypothetical protein